MTTENEVLDANPKDNPTKKPLVGIGGWLWLPLIGLILTPFQIGFGVYHDLLPLFTGNAYTALTTPTSSVYHPLWKPLLLFELIGNLSFIVFAIVSLVLFLTKSRLLPKLMVMYLSLNAVFLVGDYFLAEMIPAVASQPIDRDTIRSIARAIGGVIIWVPYFLVSKRVKNTFVH